MNELVERFAAELAPLITYRGAAHGGLVRCADLDEAADAVQRLCRAEGLERVAVAAREEVEAVARRLRGVRLVPAAGLDDARALADCDAGLGGADLLIAESATLALVDGPHEPRSLSLLPPVHLCVAFASRLVPRIHDALARLGPDGAGEPGPAAAPTITLVTGPSRTADIEKTLVVPAHGPAALHVFLVLDGD